MTAKRLAAGAVVVAFLGLSGVASAASVPKAQANSIGGTAGGSFYISPIVRHVTTPDDTIKVGLHSAPSGLYWKLINADNDKAFSATKNIPYGDHNYVTIATGVENTTRFQNDFKAYGAAGSFSGFEYY